MCTLLIGLQTDPRWPLVIAANRDEFLKRPATPPMRLSEAPRVVGGRDLVAGGTWMGVTPGGFFAGVTNQARAPGPPAPQSRGSAVLHVLTLGEVEAAAQWLRGLVASDYHPFNLLFGTAEDLRVAYARPGEPVEVAAVAPGFHVLPNDILNSPRFPKVERARALTDGTWESMEAALRDTQTPAILPERPVHMPPDVYAAVHRLLVRTPVYGTVSATSVALAPGRVGHYRYAAGGPDLSPFTDFTDQVYDTPGPTGE